MEDDLAQARRVIVRPPSQEALRPQDRRQRGGDGQQIVEMAPQEDGMDMPAAQPAVQRVQDNGRDAQRVEGISKTLHSNAHMSSPLRTARAIWPTQGAKDTVIFMRRRKLYTSYHDAICFSRGTGH